MGFYRLFFLLASFSIEAKYSLDAFKVPCEEMKLEVLTCEKLSFSNESSLSEKQRENKNIHFHFSGALITANILDQNPVKCHKDQDVNMSAYRKSKLSNKYFVSNYSCDSKSKSIKVVKPNLFCDTPGAMTIRDCFLVKTSREGKFTFSSLN